MGLGKEKMANVNSVRELPCDELTWIWQLGAHEQPLLEQCQEIMWLEAELQWIYDLGQPDVLPAQKWGLFCTYASGHTRGFVWVWAGRAADSELSSSYHHILQACLAALELFKV